MKRHLLLTLSLVAASALRFSTPSLLAAEGAAVMEKKAEKAEVADKTGKPFPFTGKVTKVDAPGMSFSLNGAKGDRVFMVTESTKITKDGAAATLGDLMVGEAVTGSVSKQGDKQMAMSLKMGAKAEAKAKAPEPVVNPAATPAPVEKPATTDAKATPTPKKAMKK